MVIARRLKASSKSGSSSSSPGITLLAGCKIQTPVPLTVPFFHVKGRANTRIRDTLRDKVESRTRGRRWTSHAVEQFRESGNGWKTTSTRKCLLNSSCQGKIKKAHCRVGGGFEEFPPRREMSHAILQARRGDVRIQRSPPCPIFRPIFSILNVFTCVGRNYQWRF